MGQRSDVRSEEARHISGSITAVIVRYVDQAVGPTGVTELLRRSGDDRTVEEIVALNGWTSYARACALFEAARDVTSDPDVGFRIGEEMLRQHTGTEVAALLRSLGSPTEVLRNVAATAAKYSTVTQLEAVHIGEESAVIAATAVEGFVRHPLMCDYTAGMLSQVSALFGIDTATVSESECQARGGPACVYNISWNGATAPDADPLRRLEHLEASYAALVERFETLRETATDLVGAADVETLLVRIGHRAGLAVRAPAHVLAVRLPGEQDVRVHSEGVASGERDHLVEQILSHDLDHQGAGLLVVEVASAHHHYGRLAAISPGTAQFFAQERRLLAAYAAQAAAALDTATALREVNRRNMTARALLGLSLELADATTPGEVASRLSETVPGVVDCDHASVLLWDARTQRLEMSASTGLDDDKVEALSAISVTPADTPLLQGVLSDHEPFFVTDSHPDAYARGLLAMAESVAVVVVPIAAGGDFFGIVTAGVHTNAARLESNADVLERLRGLAAQASAALRNAALLDEVTHRAMHDPLTDLPNRALFRDRLTQALEAGRRSGHPVGVLFLDLDQFKQINDTHGHAVGDAVITTVAGRIRSALRPSDTVARLGGDEFGIVLPDVAAREGCEVVARKLVAELREPVAVDGRSFQITASIGAVAGYRGSTYDGLVKRADAAMYDAKRAGRDTYVIAAAHGDPRADAAAARRSASIAAAWHHGP